MPDHAKNSIDMNVLHATDWVPEMPDHATYSRYMLITPRIGSQRCLITPRIRDRYMSITPRIRSQRCLITPLIREIRWSHHVFDRCVNHVTYLIPEMSDHVTYSRYTLIMPTNFSWCSAFGRCINQIYNSLKFTRVNEGDEWSVNRQLRHPATAVIVGWILLHT